MVTQADDEDDPIDEPHILCVRCAAYMTSSVVLTSPVHVLVSRRGREWAESVPVRAVARPQTHNTLKSLCSFARVAGRAAAGGVVWGGLPRPPATRGTIHTAVCVVDYQRATAAYRTCVRETPRTNTSKSAESKIF